MKNDNNGLKELLPVMMDGVSFSRGKKKVLKDVSLKIPQGEFLGLIGPNGAGKTTLLRILLGLIEPDAGEILLFGKNPRKLGKDRSLIGYLPQKLLANTYFPVTVFDVVKMGRVTRRGLLRFWQREDNEEVERTLSRLNLEELRHRPIGELSGGQQQLVFLARALVNSPKLLLVDEPTSGLDPRAQQRFYSIMDELKQEYNLSIIAISHDIGAIMHYADRLLYLNVTLQQEGKASDRLKLFSDFRFFTPDFRSVEGS